MFKKKETIVEYKRLLCECKNESFVVEHKFTNIYKDGKLYTTSSKQVVSCNKCKKEYNNPNHLIEELK